MDLEIKLRSSKNTEDPIKFGSLINISIPKLNDCFISSEGFINNKLYIQKFDSKNSYNHFISTIFKIMPFSDPSNFETQMKLFSLTNNLTELRHAFSKLGINKLSI